MALESFPKISPANFSPENDLIQVYSKKGDYVGVINPSYISGSTSPSGVAGAIQFSNGSAFASDASNLFWDDTNNRLGIGTNAPTRNFQVNGTGAFINADGNTALFLQNGNTGVSSVLHANVGSQNLYFGGFGLLTSGDATFGQLTSLSARVGIKGSGSTSATTSLLVQNSAGSSAFIVKDDLSIIFNGVTTFNNDFFVTGPNQIKLYGYSYLDIQNGISGTRILIQSTTVRLNNKMIVGTTASDAVASAQFQIDSTTTGFLPPRMTTTQKNAIASPAAGLQVYDTTTNKLCCYNGSTWNDLF